MFTMPLSCPSRLSACCICVCRRVKGEISYLCPAQTYLENMITAFGRASNSNNIVFNTYYSVVVILVDLASFSESLYSALVTYFLSDCCYPRHSLHTEIILRASHPIHTSVNAKLKVEDAPLCHLIVSLPNISKALSCACHSPAAASM